MASDHSASSEMILRMRRTFGSLVFSWPWVGVMLVFKDACPGLELLKVETCCWMLKTEWLGDEGLDGIVGLSCMLTASSEARVRTLATSQREAS